MAVLASLELSGTKHFRMGKLQIIKFILEIIYVIDSKAQSKKL